MYRPHNRIIKIDDDRAYERYDGAMRLARTMAIRKKLMVAAHALGKAEQIADMAYHMTGLERWRDRRQWADRCLFVLFDIKRGKI